MVALPLKIGKSIGYFKISPLRRQTMLIPKPDYGA